MGDVKPPGRCRNIWWITTAIDLVFDTDALKAEYFIDSAVWLFSSLPFSFACLSQTPPS